MQQKFNSDTHLKSRNKDGNIDTVLVGEEVILETSVGSLIPRFTIDEDGGRRKESPVKFYKTGELKALPLEQITEIPTSVGNIKSELVIFYKSGALWRTFPLNGKVTGFWTEENEYELAETIELNTSVGIIKVKPIYLQFYETGELQSILFWPNEHVKIQTKMGLVLIRLGISFHKNGQIKSFEPLRELSVETPIGVIKAYDPDPSGIQAENHAINYNEKGVIQKITTSSNQFLAKKDGIDYKTFSPKIVTSYCNENAFFVSPLIISFEENTISFNNNNEPMHSLSLDFELEIFDFVPKKIISDVGCC